MKRNAAVSGVVHKGFKVDLDCLYLPLKTQVMFGVGAPTARQCIVASLPSRTVWFVGLISRIGTDAVGKSDG